MCVDEGKSKINKKKTELGGKLKTKVPNQIGNAWKFKFMVNFLSGK